jgi:hypothetical protein
MALVCIFGSVTLDHIVARMDSDTVFAVVPFVAMLSSLVM